MYTSKRITIDLTCREIVPTACAVQGDAFTRQVSMELREGPDPWMVPEDATVLIHYSKPDGTQGAYDTLPDGTTAWAAVGNLLDIRLAPQMLTQEGYVRTQVTLMRGDARLSTFSFHILVDQKIASGAQSEDYYHWRDTFLPQVEGARVGQYLEISEVSEQGSVRSIRAVDAPEQLTVDTQLSGESTNPVSNYVVTQALTQKLTAPSVAAVGQTIVAAQVDENGKPTAWEAVDIKSCLPEVTAQDDGKFLRVSGGVWAAVSIQNAEEVSV